VNEFKKAIGNFRGARGFRKLWTSECTPHLAAISPRSRGFKDMIVTESKRILVCLFCAAVLSSGLPRLHAQTIDSSQSKRKVKYLGKPNYPELAKKLNLSGTVKVEVTIGADGKVKRTRVVGGHPVLATEAEKAATQCEFEAGSGETVEVIEFKFTP
jgi:protein TonB